MATLIHETDRMSSLEIAELTGKRHDNIVRDIRSLLKQGVSHLNFEESSYKQPQPRGGYKELPCFELTKKGCLILASGYDAVLREKIIDRWEQLELEKRKPKTPQTYLEALKALVSSEEEKQRLAQEKKQLEQKNAKLQPKADFADAASRKICFLFGYIESIRIFVALTDGNCIYLAGQAVNLLILYMGIFYARTLGYWRLSIRRYLDALRGMLSSVSSVYGNRYFVAYNISLNAYRYE